MPIYEYICEDCDEKYEKLVRSSQAKVKLLCPSCGSERGRKAFSVFGSVGNSAKSGGALNNFSAPAPACGPIG